ncbi:hypothetical protein [Longimicrobium sp.]|uniref:hypothetical protein n=1 Tax=Longimicrobium sp. TaxID=2029185 RepID=UPI003B3A9C45
MSASDMDRRAFVRTAARAGALMLAGSGFRFTPRPEVQDALRIVFIPGSGSASASAARGVTMGYEEAARTGELVGRRIALVTADSVDDAAALAGDARPAALVGGFDDAQCDALARVARGGRVLAMNVGCRSDRWRSTACARNLFHVEASDCMYADARAARGEDGQVPADAVLWHPSLERFGAAQLNDRFRARFGGPMDGAAWAGWMAVKVLWEASLRARTTQPGELRTYLESGLTNVDGHKGWPLSFRAWNHQLRQPLYLVGSAGRVVGEAPVRRPGDDSRAALDVLGGKEPSAAVCEMTR